MRDDDFMVGSWSDYPRIVFLLAEALHGVSAEILNLQISWQAQYLVRLEADCAARDRAADGADGAGVRMVLRDTVLRTVRTVHAAGVRMCVRMLLRDTVLRTVRTVLV